MPTSYEKTYGEVTFYDLSGTKLYAMTADLDLWLVEDTEPSPEPKWVRVDVPGADGAVDLSRALAGQVTYHQRDISLRFTGIKASHSAALATVRALRKALHGARVKVETMLTKLSSGYYIADCECDGEADPEGIVNVTVTAKADPFIRTGTQTLWLIGGNEYTTLPANVIDSPVSDLLKGAGSIGSEYGKFSSNYMTAPDMATTAHLWWSMGENLLNPSLLTVRAFYSTDDWSTHHEHPVTVNGQAVNLGSIDSARSYKVFVLSSPRKGDITRTALPYFTVGTSPARSVTMGVYMTGSISSVATPKFQLERHHNLRIASDGYWASSTSSKGTGTVDTTPTATDYYQQLMSHFQISGSGYDTYTYQGQVVQIDGITGTDVALNLSLLNGSVTPGAWEAARLDYATVDFGGRFYANAASNESDSVTIKSNGEVITVHNFPPASTAWQPISPAVTTYGTIDGWPPLGSKYLMLSPIDQYGGECAFCYVSSHYYDILTATGSNTTMRSVPTITSTGGAYVEIDGRTAIVDAGTVELQGMTIPGGAFSVDYALLGGADASLKWEGGVL